MMSSLITVNHKCVLLTVTEIWLTHTHYHDYITPAEWFRACECADGKLNEFIGMIGCIVCDVNYNESV